MTPVEQQVAELRLLAAIQDETAEGRRKNGLPDSDCIENARSLRIRADLLEQGIPADAIKSELPAGFIRRQDGQ